VFVHLRRALVGVLFPLVENLVCFWPLKVKDEKLFFAKKIKTFIQEILPHKILAHQIITFDAQARYKLFNDSITCYTRLKTLNLPTYTLGIS
jgi:hypothetical protein